MPLLNKPMSQEQKRLRLRSAMKLLLEGEDFDYICMTLRNSYPASLSTRELKDIVLKIAALSAQDRDVLIRDIAPDRLDNRHFEEAAAEKSRVSARIERAEAASHEAGLKWQKFTSGVKYWLNLLFWTTAATILVLAFFVG